jgi:hypothetical protein
MADAPDLAKIVGLIMEHPEIVGQISALLSTDGASETAKDTAEVNATPSVAAPKAERRNDRARLLGAMKPYLSESRARAVDTMITVAEILESMKGGG